MKNNNDEIEKIIPSSPNFQTELAQKIAEIVPEAMSDGKIDVVKLRELINGDVENSPEKFGLFWPGKARAQAVAQIPTSATLVPAPEESVNWENTKNIYIEGDNLEVLKALQNSYRRKIKMIYIDPPYNTGKEFIYPDNFQEGLQTYLEYTGQKNEAGEITESKKETGGRKHTNWLNMMYPRLQLAKSLLTDDGVIFISIDDNEQANLKLICDSIFENENFIGTIVHQRAKGGGNANTLVKGHDIILAYARNITVVNPLMKPKSQQVKVIEKDGNKYIKNDDIYRKTFGKYEKGVERRLLYEEIELIKGVDKKKEIDSLLSDGKIYLEKRNDGSHIMYSLTPVNNAFSKFYSIINVLSEKGKQRLENLKLSNYFDYPKPVELIKQLIQAVCLQDKNAIILDFFSGSASTADALMLQNSEDDGDRRFIQVQLPEPTDEKSEAYKAGFKTISDIGKERIRRAGKKILEDYAEKLKKRKEPLDVGFRVYKLAPSNFVQWNEEKAKENIQQSILDFADNKKSNTSPEAILSEIMLQNKITLDAKIEKKQLSNDGWVYVVDDGNLIAYVNDKQITEDQAKEIAEMTPGKLIVVDSAFNGNDALKINVANICKEKFIKEFKTI